LSSTQKHIRSGDHSFYNKKNDHLLIRRRGSKVVHRNHLVSSKVTFCSRTKGYKIDQLVPKISSGMLPLPCIRLSKKAVSIPKTDQSSKPDAVSEKIWSCCMTRSCCVALSRCDGSEMMPVCWFEAPGACSAGVEWVDLGMLTRIDPIPPILISPEP
jgi:hypothetical protein